VASEWLSERNSVMQVFLQSIADQAAGSAQLKNGTRV
jgi:hypothetical protein